MTERHYQDEQQRSFSRPTNEDPETGGGKLVQGDIQDLDQESHLSGARV